MAGELNTYGQNITSATKHLRMIDNYVYLYHTDTLVVLPSYPESIQDTTGITYSENVPISSAAPTFSYSNSGPRSLQVELPLHRDLMRDINYSESTIDFEKSGVDMNDDYVDVLVKQLQSMALPRYASTEKMVNPPLIAVRFGNSIFCKGVIQGQVTVTHSGPLLSYGEGPTAIQKYAMLTVSFTVTEVDPYDADTVALAGGYRGLSTTLEGRIFKAAR